jgi:hypothetical protein
MSESVKFEINWAGVTHQNVDCLKLMVNKTFPLSYEDSLYHKIIHDYKDNTFFCKFSTPKIIQNYK